MPSEPTPPLDEFLKAFEENDNEWWYLQGGDHLNLFEEAVDRLARVRAAIALISPDHITPMGKRMLHKALNGE